MWYCHKKCLKIYKIAERPSSQKIEGKEIGYRKIINRSSCQGW